MSSDKLINVAIDEIVIFVVGKAAADLVRKVVIVAGGARSEHCGVKVADCCGEVVGVHG